MLWFKYLFFILFSSSTYCSYANAKYAKSKIIFFLIFILTIASIHLVFFNIFVFAILEINSWKVYIYDSTFGIIFLLTLTFSYCLYKIKNFCLGKSNFLISLIIFVLIFTWEILFMWYWTKETINNKNFSTINLLFALTNIFILFLFLGVIWYQWDIYSKTLKTKWQVNEINFDEIKQNIIKKDILYWNNNEIIDKNYNIKYCGTFILKINNQYKVKNIFNYENIYFEITSTNNEKFNFFVVDKEKINIEISQEIIKKQKNNLQ